MNLGGFQFDPRTGVFRASAESGGGTPHRRARPVRPAGRRHLTSALITLAFGLVYYYFALPAINLHAMEFYVFILLLCAVTAVAELAQEAFTASGARDYVRHLRRSTALPFYVACLCIVFIIVGSIIGWRVFRARDYADLLQTQDGDFASEVAEISFDDIPMLDKDSANVLANRKLGELSDLVSQFEVYGDSFQINYQDRPVRVTYLNYGDVFKWLSNQKNGIPAYLIIDMVTQDVTVHRLENGIRYSPSEYFFRDLNRYLRLKYPTKMFSDVNFEIDENGDPYWVATVVTKKVGLFGGTDAVGAVLLNAVTGDCTYYEAGSVPTWVDRVFTAELLMQQYDYYGLYHNGFWNSLFGQRGCTETTSGYNYIAQDDDVWIYTGVTSVSGDQGNIGFILVNQRTKESRYYACAGAEEYSAMSSAQGAVQQYAYEATFPLLLNVGGQPTYFMALKDASSLVKMYAMVNVQQYQIVSTGASVSDCAANYEALLVNNGILDAYSGLETAGLQTASGTLTDIRSAVIDGNTVYYLRLSGSDVYYSISAADDAAAVTLNPGDRVDITYAPADGNLVPARSVLLK